MNDKLICDLAKNFIIAFEAEEKYDSIIVIGIKKGEKKRKYLSEYVLLDGKYYEEREGCYVHQITGELGDDYYGSLLFELENDEYLVIKYEC